MIAALVAMSMFAAPVDPATASKLATNFLGSSRQSGMLKAPMGTSLELKKAEPSRVLGAGPVFYIYTTKYSYVVVAGDDRAEQILAYGDYALDVNNMPPGMKDMLNQYKDEIEYLQKNPTLKVDPIVSPKNSPSLRSASVGPLLTCNWDQDAPFWNECYFGGYQCYTGCPATSAAMVFYYWKYPTDPVPALPGYASTIDYSYYGSIDYNHSPMPSITFDWDNMIDDYTGSYTQAQGAAVAALMHYIGHAERMMYGTSAAGGSGVYVDSVGNIRDAFIICDYDTTTLRFIKKSSAYSGGTTLYTDDEWAAILQEEMYAERPVVFCAVGTSGGGHAFNVDGYDSDNNKYHINFGWSGSYNDWYALNAFKGQGSTYSVYQQMVIGIQPPAIGPAIKVNPAKLTMEGFVDQSSTATIVVKGQELNSAIAVTLNDESGYFSIDAASVALNEQEEGKAITVTYAPEAVGTHNATLTLTNADAETKVVAITATATLDTYRPVMLPANETYVNLTQFRADWTDQTADKYVDSYTLMVSTQPATTLIVDEDFSDLPSGSNIASNPTPYLPEGWTFSGSSLWLDGACLSVGTNGRLVTQQFELDGYEKVTIIVRAKNDSEWASAATLAVETSLEKKTTKTLGEYQDYTFVLNCSENENFKIGSDNYYCDIVAIKIYAGELDNATLKAIQEDGDATWREITGITNKYYTVKDLEAGGTFYYKVRALNTDGTQSAWSKTECVTLFNNGSIHVDGDVNHDGIVNVTDITELIAAVLDNGEGVCPDCADLTGDGLINITDVTELINMVLNSAR